jgi:uncharacterized Zn-binding protein involved in type VI secretion
MPGITRFGDNSEAHPGIHGFRAQKVGEGSPNVRINGKKVIRVGDIWVDGHSPTPDDEKVLVGSPNVRVNGAFVARKGDTIANCGVKVFQSSPNVFANGTNTGPTGGTNSVLVTITDPSDGALLALDVPFTLTADAISALDSIASVQFFDSGSPISSPITVPPYSTTYTFNSIGNFILTAVAIDTGGNQSTSPSVNVNVEDSGGGGGGGG